MKIYLAGPMTNMPYFNFPAFDYAAKKLRDLGFAQIFNPAEHDRRLFGNAFSDLNPTGDATLAEVNYGFSLRAALEVDLSWIAREATAIALLPGWEQSKGACAELALAKALGLTVIELGQEFVE